MKIRCLSKIICLFISSIATLIYNPIIIGVENQKLQLTAVIMAELSYGELIDKITILRIKKERMHDAIKKANVIYELEILEQTVSKYIIMSEQLQVLIDQLQAINEQLWDIEDAIRLKERDQQFDDDFIQLARNVYFTNDKRSLIKRHINELCGSSIIEEKSYKEYANRVG